MKNIIRKIWILLLLIPFTIIFIKVNAVSSDSGAAQYVESTVTKSFVTDYTSYKTSLGITTYSGTNYNQRVHTFYQKQTANSKVVTWAVKSNAGKFTLCPVTAICSNYEAFHPGWKVVGAINADQYTTGFGTNIPSTGKDYYYPQPYYSMICDNEGWFVMTGIPTSGNQNILGFKQDGSSDCLIHGASNLNHGDLKFSGLFMYILDADGNRLEKIQINHINETPRELETSIWTSHYDENKEFKDINVTGNLYVVERADKAICNNSIDYQYKGSNAVDAFFGKGVISLEASNATFGYGAFAIDTKDEYVKSRIAKGTRVLVQYELEGEFSEVESAIGYHTIHRLDDKDIPSGGSYNTSKYTRSIVGRTKDGKIFLMAVDQTEYAGMNWEEIDACLKYYGIVEAYQMDGGGSTTAVIRENDKFVVVNSPRDGSPRSVFSALLLVEKDEETEVNLTPLINNIYKLSPRINKFDLDILIKENNLYNDSYKRLEK